jgi:hypothetical protein
MIRCSVPMLIFMSFSGSALAASEANAGAATACLYESRAYSEGAYICVQKSLMQVCASDGVRATWKPVADQNINDRCTAPIALNHPVEHRSRGYGRHAIFHRISPPGENSAKCFLFNGKQYCE